MSNNLTELEDKQFQVLNPVEIDLAAEDLRKYLARLQWVTHPFHIAQRFYEKDDQKKTSNVFPEIYLSSGQETKDGYFRLTPNNEISGMFFFVVGNGRPNEDRYLTYNVGIIFAANMEIINPAKYKNYLFTQELISQVRKLLKDGEKIFDFSYKIKEETRDIRNTFKEFVLDQIQTYNRAPMQCFRFNLEITVETLC